MGLRLSPIAVAALLSSAVGCAADAEPNDDAIEQAADELNVSLKNFVVVKASMSEPGTITVAYEPAGYGQTGLRVPFLAIELPSEDSPFQSVETTGSGIRPANNTVNDSSRMAISVSGDFPGTPQLVVTDANFAPVTSARGRKTDLGGAATVHVTPNRGKFVLVRDRLWVKPMTFQVTVRP